MSKITSKIHKINDCYHFLRSNNYENNYEIFDHGFLDLEESLILFSEMEHDIIFSYDMEYQKILQITEIKLMEISKSIKFDIENGENMLISNCEKIIFNYITEIERNKKFD